MKNYKELLQHPRSLTVMYLVQALLYVGTCFSLFQFQQTHNHKNNKRNKMKHNHQRAHFNKRTVSSLGRMRLYTDRAHQKNHHHSKRMEKNILFFYTIIICNKHVPFERGLVKYAADAVQGNTTRRQFNCDAPIWLREYSSSEFVLDLWVTLLP